MLQKKYNEIILAMFIVIVIFFGNLSNILAANNIAEYENELEKVKQEQKENAAKLTGIEKELALYAYEVANYDSQMLQLSKEMAQIQNDMDEVNQKLEKLEESLQNSDSEYAKAQKSYAARLRSLYENGLPSIWDIYLSSVNIAEFFVKMDIYTRILEYDRDTISKFKNKKEYVDFIKKDIEIQKLQLEGLKNENEESVKALDLLRETKEKRMKELESTQAELVQNSNSLVQKRKDAISRIDEEVARVIKEAQQDIDNGTSTTFTGGDFVWPVKGYVTITTRFGQVYNFLLFSAFCRQLL